MKTQESTTADATKMQRELSDKLLPMFEAVRRERQSYYESHPTPGKDQLNHLISSYSYKCGAIAFGCNLVPGPWGMLAIVPEIALVLREQLKMVYDIGRAFGHEKITVELLLGILLSAVGSGTGGVLIVQGGKVVVKRASLRMIQRLVAALGGKVTQKVLKSLLAKWVPFLGATAMAAWAKHSTTKLGRYAVDIFSQSIQFDDSVVDAEPETESSFVDGNQLLIQKIRLMISMAWIDRRVHVREAEFIDELLAKVELSDSDKQELRQGLDSGKPEQVDYGVFSGRDDEKVATIMDLVVLMKIDGEIHPAEKIFVKKVGTTFGLAPDELDDLIAAC